MTKSTYKKREVKNVLKNRQYNFVRHSKSIDELGQDELAIKI